MTPGVVRTVEELGYDVEALEQDLYRHQPIMSMKDGSIAGCQCLDRVFHKRTEDWGTHLAEVFLALPATVLAPLSVTPEQVEAGARALWASGAPPDDHEPWLVASEEDRADFRRDLLAALAAMGFTITTGGE